jgi:uncharacterized protein (TIGR00369 family)
MSGPHDDDDLARFIGLRLTAAGEARLTVRPELVNSIGKLLGPVAFALVDYAMGSVVWDGLEPGRAAATVNIAINFLDSADAGEVVCTAAVDRRGARLASTSAQVRHGDDGRLLMTAVGTFAATRPSGARAAPPR